MATAIVKRTPTKRGEIIEFVGGQPAWRAFCEKNGGSHVPSSDVYVRPLVEDPHPNRGKSAHQPNQDFLFKRAGS